jgi:hypothetical protein
MTSSTLVVWIKYSMYVQTVVFCMRQIDTKFHFGFEHGPGILFRLISLGVEHSLDQLDVPLMDRFFFGKDESLCQFLSVEGLGSGKGLDTPTA